MTRLSTERRAQIESYWSRPGNRRQRGEAQQVWDLLAEIDRLRALLGGAA